MATHLSPSHPLRIRIVGTLAALLLAGGLAACGDDDDGDVSSGGDATTTTAADDLYGGAGDTASTAADGGADAAGVAVVAKDREFTAPSVASGAEVTFTNEDSVPHTVTADDGAFDAGRVEGGASGTFEAPSEPGDYPFHCEIHPDMQATLTVEA